MCSRTLFSGVKNKLRNLNLDQVWPGVPGPRYTGSVAKSVGESVMVAFWKRITLAGKQNEKGTESISSGKSKEAVNRVATYLGYWLVF
jgi:ribosomal protein S17E